MYCQLIIINLLLLLRMGHTFDIRVGNYKEAKFDRFDGACGNKKDLLITFNCDSIKVENGILFMNGTFNSTKDIFYPLAFQLTLQRCRSKENLDTCENFYSFRTDKFCQLSGNDIWRSFFNSIEPKWGCPIHKDVYVVNNAKVDISAFLLFPTKLWFWKGRGELLDQRTKKVLMCVLIETTISVRRF